MTTYNYLTNVEGQIIEEAIGNPRDGWFQSENQIDATQYMIVNGSIVSRPAPIITLDAVKVNKIQAFYDEFVAKKTAIVWVDGRGYDADTNSNIDFLNAKDLARDLRNEWLATLAKMTDEEKKENPIPEPTVEYRVWTDATEKNFLPHTHADFVKVQKQASIIQRVAFDFFYSRRAQILAANTIEELSAIR